MACNTLERRRSQLYGGENLNCLYVSIQIICYGTKRTTRDLVPDTGKDYIRYYMLIDCGASYVLLGGFFPGGKAICTLH
jgi:hypothetical protein